MDDVPLMMQFYKGLKDSIKDDLIKEEWLDTISKYMQCAICIDNCNYEWRLEKQHLGWVYKGLYGYKRGHMSYR